MSQYIPASRRVTNDSNSPLGRLLMKWNGAEQYLYRRMYPLIQERIADSEPQSSNVSDGNSIR